MNTDAVVRVAKRASNVVQEGEVNAGKCTGVNHRPPEETWEGRSSVRDTGGDEKRRYLRLGQRRGLQDPGLGGGWLWSTFLSRKASIPAKKINHCILLNSKSSVQRSHK